MNETLANALAVQLAEVASEALPVDATELAYGRDLSCVQDLSDDFRETREGSALIILEALVRRFQTPRGTLGNETAEELDYGLDLCSRCHAPFTSAELRALQSQCVGEAMKDERVESASFALSFSVQTSTLSVTGRITPRDPRLNVFRFVLRATTASVLIESIEEAA